MLQTELRGNAGKKITFKHLTPNIPDTSFRSYFKPESVPLYSVLDIVLQIAVLTNSERKDAAWAQKQGMERDGFGGVAG